MSRPSDTEIAADIRSSATEGACSPRVWAQVILERVLTRGTGILSITNDDNERTFCFMAGIPVSAQSNVSEEDFTETMVATGVLPKARLKWIRKHTNAEESEVEALIGAGTISRAEVDAHHKIHIQHLIGAGLSWIQATWSWLPTPEVESRFEVSLLPNVNALEGLISGVLGSFDLGDLRGFIDTGDTGDFVADARLTNGEQNWIPEDMAQVSSIMGQNMDRSTMATQLQCDPDRLASLLWILEATGWTHRSQAPAALEPLGTIAMLTVSDSPDAPPTESTPAARPAAVQAAAQTPAHRQPPSPQQQTQPPKTASSTAPLQKPTPRKTAAPPARAKPKPIPKKVAAPKKAAKLSPAKRLQQALESVNSEDFDGAYTQLVSIRKERPSCPNTLAALGWCAWKTGNLGSNAYDGPEDYLLLALTFDAEHPKALEYYARIAIDQEQTETARNRLLQVLKVNPTSSWAKEALDECAPSSRKGGLRLWPKSKS
jgi:hypothetical protein